MRFGRFFSVCFRRTKITRQETVHVPVLLQEVLALLEPKPGGIYIDGTLGGGGHTEAIFRRADGRATLISMDRDREAIDRTEKRLKATFPDVFDRPEPAIRFVHANYRYFEEALDLLGVPRVDGILLDLGLSSDQLADRNRGFSFEADGPLDLRFDASEGETAVELLNRLKENEIADLIYRYGEERFSRRIARSLVQRRESGTMVQTATDLADLVRRCVPRTRNPGIGKDSGKRSLSIDPATRTFQALRIAVNDELGSLQNLLEKAPDRLNPGAVAVVISFHSLEDRIVKNAFRDDSRWEIVTKKPVLATDEEVRGNPRARSAKLRAAKRIP